jgi:hypothetical protein
MVDVRHCDRSASSAVQELPRVKARSLDSGRIRNSPGSTLPADAPGVTEATGTYEPRDPTQSVLFPVVCDHFETFRSQAASLRDGEGLLRFVEREFREFLTCGCLAAGFARFHCDACGRRMAERAAHLIDHVLPGAQIRQWVLESAISSAVPARVGS